MAGFNHLVSTQLQTMEKLLHLQGELERCQNIEQELILLGKETELEDIHTEIELMKKDLREIHAIFEKQTEEVIRSYQEENIVYR
ncbi:YgaB family protein [Mesobacillus harenae]|uniref:YgaB family protein n=1 Tax=Mesobacillus harenae TaxID=2213203 RepID=UPI001580BDD6|nr:YgaB family protein [Mesobacillus harenae]